MSVNYLNFAFSTNAPRGSERCVLLALAHIANDSGMCQAGLQEIATMAKVDRRQVIRLLHELENKGFVRVTRSKDGNENLQNIYELFLREGDLA